MSFCFYCEKHIKCDYVYKNFEFCSSECKESFKYNLYKNKIKRLKEIDTQMIDLQREKNRIIKELQDNEVNLKIL
jgi:hypothetical protein